MSPGFNTSLPAQSESPDVLRCGCDVQCECGHGVSNVGSASPFLSAEQRGSRERRDRSEGSTSARALGRKTVVHRLAAGHVERLNFWEISPK